MDSDYETHSLQKVHYCPIRDMRYFENWLIVGAYDDSCSIWKYKEDTFQLFKQFKTESSVLAVDINKNFAAGITDCFFN